MKLPRGACRPLVSHWEGFILDAADTHPSHCSTVNVNPTTKLKLTQLSEGFNLKAHQLLYSCCGDAGGLRNTIVRVGPGHGPRPGAVRRA